jgi:hypothetical protein
MVSNRTDYDDTLQKIADNLFGRRDFNTTRTPGRNRKQRIYDDTASQLLDMLSGAMHSLTINPAEIWYDLRFSEESLNENQNAAIWLTDVKKRLFNALNSSRANLHSQVAEMFIDLCGFGTGGLFIDEVPGRGVQFSNRPLQELYLTEDAAGVVHSVARCFKLTAEQAVAAFGEKAKQANRSIARNGFEDKCEYRQLIVPVESDEVRRLAETQMPFASFLISCEDHAVMSSGGFHEMPIVTPRWSKEPGEVYGRGCGHNALSNGAGLNEQKKAGLMTAQLAVAPPFIYDQEGVMPGDVAWAPRALIPVDTTTSQLNPPLQELRTNARWDVSKDLLTMDQESVRAAFHWPLLQTLQNPHMTATHVLELSSQQQRHIAPILGRLATEALDPLLSRVFAIESRAGRIPPPPPEVLEGVAGNENDIRFDYVSPVFRALRASAARSIIDYASTISNLSSVVPDVLDVVDMDEGARELARELGVPPSMVKSAVQVEEIRDARNQAAAEDMSKQDAVTLTDQVAKLAKAAPNAAA